MVLGNNQFVITDSLLKYFRVHKDHKRVLYLFKDQEVFQLMQRIQINSCSNSQIFAIFNQNHHKLFQLTYRIMMTSKSNSQTCAILNQIHRKAFQLTQRTRMTSFSNSQTNAIFNQNHRNVFQLTYCVMMTSNLHTCAIFSENRQYIKIIVMSN